MSMSKYVTQDEYFAAIRKGISEKAVVQYTPTALPIIVGEGASVVVYDHPSVELNYAPFVHTTRVVSYDEATGEFETRNTKYVLKK